MKGEGRAENAGPLPHISVLDLKDYRGNRFVTPGEGLMDFGGLSAVMAQGRVESISVEVEEHHHTPGFEQRPEDIDRLHIDALGLYRKWFHGFARGRRRRVGAGAGSAPAPAGPARNRWARMPRREGESFFSLL